MIYITQLIYIIKDQESVFDEFENKVIPLIAKYDGLLLFRLRPSADDFISCDIDIPFEIHLVQFPTDAQFRKFLEDKDRQAHIQMKNDSIRLSIIIVGNSL